MARAIWNYQSKSFKKISQLTHKLAQCGPGLVCCCMTELWLKSLEKETENTKNVSLSDC